MSTKKSNKLGRKLVKTGMKVKHYHDAGMQALTTSASKIAVGAITYTAKKYIKGDDDIDDVMKNVGKGLIGGCVASYGVGVGIEVMTAQLSKQAYKNAKK